MSLGIQVATVASGGAFGITVSAITAYLASKSSRHLSDEIERDLGVGTAVFTGKHLAYGKRDATSGLFGSDANEDEAVHSRARPSSQHIGDDDFDLRDWTLGSAEPQPRNQSDTYAILAKYSAQGLAQSRVSFIVSIVFAALGFLVIVGGVFLLVFRESDKAAAVIPVVAGAVVDAVAGLFFTVNARTQKVMVEFFDKLRADRRVEDSIKIAGELQPELGERLKVLLALRLSEVGDLTATFAQVAGAAPVEPPAG